MEQTPSFDPLLFTNNNACYVVVISKTATIKKTGVTDAEFSWERVGGGWWRLQLFGTPQARAERSHKVKLGNHLGLWGWSWRNSKRPSSWGSWSWRRSWGISWGGGWRRSWGFYRSSNRTRSWGGYRSLRRLSSLLWRFSSLLWRFSSLLWRFSFSTIRTASDTSLILNSSMVVCLLWMIEVDVWCVRDW